MNFTTMNKNRDFFKRQWMESKKTDKPPSEEVLTSYIEHLAGNAAAKTTRDLHFEYDNWAKAKVLQTKGNPVGALVGQFQTYRFSLWDMQWQMLKDLKLQRFKWKDRRLGDIYSYGWIAQVVENEYPEFVRIQPASLEQERAGETPTLKTVQSGTIQKRAIAALQEAMERIEALEAKVVALESK